MKYLASLLFLVFIFPHFAYAGVNTHSATFVGSSAQYAWVASPTGVPTGGSARTVCAWVKNTVTSEEYVVGYGSGSSAGAFDLTVDVNLVSIRQNGGNHRWTATNVNNGSWHHICVVYPGGSVNINSTTVDAYMDGSVLADSTSAAGVTNTVMGRVSIGSDCQSGSCSVPTVFHTGSVDDVQIYNTALTSTDISTLYSTPCDISDSATGLVARWRLDNTFNDSTSNANNLTTSVSSPTFSSSDLPYTCSTPESTKYPFIKMIGDVIMGSKYRLSQ